MYKVTTITQHPTPNTRYYQNNYYGSCCGNPSQPYVFMICAEIRLRMPETSEQYRIAVPFCRNVLMSTKIVGKQLLLFSGGFGSQIAVKQLLYVFFVSHHVIVFISCNNLFRAFDIMPLHEDSVVPSTSAISAKLICSHSLISTIFLHL